MGEIKVGIEGLAAYGEPKREIFLVRRATGNVAKKEKKEEEEEEERKFRKNLRARSSCLCLIGVSETAGVLRTVVLTDESTEDSRTLFRSLDVSPRALSTLLMVDAISSWVSGLRASFDWSV